MSFLGKKHESALGFSRHRSLGRSYRRNSKPYCYGSVKLDAQFKNYCTRCKHTLHRYVGTRLYVSFVLFQIDTRLKFQISFVATRSRFIHSRLHFISIRCQLSRWNSPGHCQLRYIGRIEYPIVVVPSSFQRTQRGTATRVRNNGIKRR